MRSKIPCHSKNVYMAANAIWPEKVCNIGADDFILFTRRIATLGVG
jgi:hypothetical protein